MSLGGKLRYAAGMLFPKEDSMLKVGDMAPDFEVRDHNGKPLKLSDLKGKNVILWFFPKADTPG